MPAIDIPEAKDKLEEFFSPDQCTIRNLLIENGQLIETAAEYQRMGKIEEAIKYQKLLHQNLMRAATMADPQYSAQMMQEIGGSKPAEEDNQSTSATVGQPSMASPPQPMQINATHSPATQQQISMKAISPQQSQRGVNMNAPTPAAAVYPQPPMQQQIPLQPPPPQQMVYGQPGPVGGHYNGFMMHHQQSPIPPPNSHGPPPQMAPMHHPYAQQTPYPPYGGAPMYQHHQQMQQQGHPQQPQLDRINQP